MNKFTQSFIDKNLEKQYFKDQFQELLDFYKWACYLGSISAVCVFVMEFISPFDFGILKYFLCVIPISFFVSFRIIVKYPHYFNFVLGSMNLALGLMIDILLILFINSEILFLAGQTVALIQYSLLIGTNVIANLTILFINQTALIVISSYLQNYFKSLQIMFILALILIMKSIWSNNKMKRQFFLIKYLNNDIQESLDNVFNLGQVYCSFNKRSQQIKLNESNQWIKRHFDNQQDFTYFLRDFIVTQSPRTSTQTIQNQHQQPKSTTLELLVFNRFVNERSVITTNNFLIVSKTRKIGFRLCLHETVRNTEKVLILMLQEDRQYQLIMKLKQKLKYKHNSLINFLEINNSNHQALREFKQILNYSQKSQKQFQLPIAILYDILHKYYNILLSNQFLKIGKIIKVRIQLLKKDILEIFNYHILKQNLQIDFDFKDNIICQTNYLLLLQIIVNLLKQYSAGKNNIRIKITTDERQLVGIDCISFQIQFEKSFQINLTRQKVDFPFTCNYDKINQTILRKIGWNKEIRTLDQQYMLQIEFEIVKDMYQFQNQIRNI